MAIPVSWAALHSAAPGECSSQMDVLKSRIISRQSPPAAAKVQEDQNIYNYIHALLSPSSLNFCQ